MYRPQTNVVTRPVAGNRWRGHCACRTPRNPHSADRCGGHRGRGNWCVHKPMKSDRASAVNFLHHARDSGGMTIYEVPRFFGWALLKLVTLGRYKSDPTNVLIEGFVGFASTAAVIGLNHPLAIDRHGKACCGVTRQGSVGRHGIAARRVQRFAAFFFFGRRSSQILRWWRGLQERRAREDARCQGRRQASHLQTASASKCVNSGNGGSVNGDRSNQNYGDGFVNAPITEAGSA
jgi:hypothetical protein